MRKQIFYCIFMTGLCCFACPFAFGQQASKPECVQSPLPGISISNSQLKIKSVFLSKTSISGEDKERKIEVQVEAEDPDAEYLEYSYETSGGSIIGTGTKVSWDLSTVSPGVYHITYRVTNGLKLIKTSRSVSILPSTADPNGFIFRFSDSRLRILNPFPDNVIPNVMSLSLTTEAADSKCIKSNDNLLVCGVDARIDVMADACDPDGDVLDYSFNASSGKIIGKGPKVVWDLSGVKPGEYTITVAVDDGCGFCGKTMTKTVKVVECADCKSQ